MWNVVVVVSGTVRILNSPMIDVGRNGVNNELFASGVVVNTFIACMRVGVGHLRFNNGFFASGPDDTTIKCPISIEPGMQQEHLYANTHDTDALGSTEVAA